MKVRAVEEFIVEVLLVMQNFNRSRGLWRVTRAEATLFMHPTPDGTRDDRDALLLRDASPLDSSLRVAEFEVRPHQLTLQHHGRELTSFGAAMVTALHDRIIEFSTAARQSLEVEPTLEPGALLRLRFDQNDQNFSVVREGKDSQLLPHYIVFYLEVLTGEVRA
jgi:hypothetical protein